MIDVGDSLVSVDGKKINSTDTATKAILGYTAKPNTSNRNLRTICTENAVYWIWGGTRRNQTQSKRNLCTICTTLAVACI
eukprot:3660318-Rhodomonas_salina.1